jgi:hypothetical protein
MLIQNDLTIISCHIAAISRKVVSTGTLLKNRYVTAIPLLQTIIFCDNSRDTKYPASIIHIQNELSNPCKLSAPEDLTCIIDQENLFGDNTFCLRVLSDDVTTQWFYQITPEIEDLWKFKNFTVNRVGQKDKSLVCHVMLFHDLEGK